ncbi:hypothetical protein RAC89_16390 [Paenibacillus sp. GD4]|jgi:hypothetical protein|uniref:hypothetical protein n=1 Tax=Paenibacillus sp. GD4 TaxID=3068890 RepID=UPI002796B45F|nr:hypothetical protein [Paenibacillus sp. GD4]MDQ1911963.1 hypothetical protein [Paenibacillus sp. GD4]
MTEKPLQEKNKQEPSQEAPVSGVSMEAQARTVEQLLTQPIPEAHYEDMNNN